MSDKVPMTPEGYKRLQDRLKQIKAVERPKVLEAIEIARAHGDLSENAEYDAAKEAQSHMEGQIKATEDKLARAEVIDPKKIDSDKVAFGATVALVDLETDEKVSYQIVGLDEADLKNKTVSIQSPIARAMIGKKLGDEVVVKTPAKTREYEVIAIEYK